jgi:hypothetical protein
MKSRVGCWLHERWRAELVLSLPSVARVLSLCWLDLHNRAERLRRDARTGGRECTWQESSWLTVSRVFPEVGARLLTHALTEWPIKLQGESHCVATTTPAVSILIPIGGLGRLAQFELALAAARAQQMIVSEVIVVEQSAAPALAATLPADVRYFHQLQSDPSAGFNKSWALNRAAREARGDVLIVLDADYLLPCRFAAECHRVLAEVEAVRPARLLFYLDEVSTLDLVARGDLSRISGMEKVVANNPTPIAIRRSTYWEIGGHDEGYFGWGGEDSEFLDRLRTRPISEAGWLPVVHAWHAPAEKKADGDRNRAFHESRMSVTASRRVSSLRTARGGGDVPTPIMAQPYRLESVADASERSPVR